MPRMLVTTVGTSLLTNRDSRPWAGWRRDQSLPEASDVDQWLTTADEVAASAETNTLRGLELDPLDCIRLLHSATPEGRFCSARLKTLYDRHCREAVEIEIEELGYHQESFAQRGLRSLITSAMGEINAARRAQLQPVFCATGGFKAEIAFLNLLGALLEVEVYYIHEQFREIVRLPRLPLTWNTDYVLEQETFFTWIDAEPRRSEEVESWLKSRPQLRSLVEDDGDGHTYLNAAGDLLFRAARELHMRQPLARWPAPDARPPDRKSGLSDISHHRPDGWQAYVHRLCCIDCVTHVQYDSTNFGGADVRIIDAETGTIGVRYGPSNNQLPLRVGTTARGLEQTELVKDYIGGFKRV